VTVTLDGQVPLADNKEKDKSYLLVLVVSKSSSVVVKAMDMVDNSQRMPRPLGT
jgi:hypothetical protein